MPEPIQNPLTPYERLQRGPRRSVVVGIMVGLFLFLVAPGVFALWFSIFEAQTMGERAIFLVLATLALAIPTLLVVASCRRKWKTGRWTASPEERMALWGKSRGKTLPKWLNPAMAITYTVLTGVGVAAAVRKPSDVWSYIFLPFWIALAAHFLWTIHRDSRKRPQNA